MAILQISQITVRSGLQENLPQLAGGEFGWSNDTRQLYIGNGTLAEGAPVVGNTEILTEFSDILNYNTTYTYKGQAAGYTVQTGPTGNTPVIQSMQTWMDQFATVKDFGAKGDGTTDDTAAINRALHQLYCIQTNAQIRRSLFFPAGVYKVSGTINIPPFATLYGEGKDNSIIQLVTTGGTVPYVAQTADSLQQTGANIGTKDAQYTPQYITISNMAFQVQSDITASPFLLAQATNCDFNGVAFMGANDTNSLKPPSYGANPVSPYTYSVNFASTSSIVTSDIVFDECIFTGTTFGIATGQELSGITISKSSFGNFFNLPNPTSQRGGLFGGVWLSAGSDFTAVNGGPTGVRIVDNKFDNIYSKGINFGNAGTPTGLNASGHNIFYDVGNYFQGITMPVTSIIIMSGNNNVSISDMFARADEYSITVPRIYVGQPLNISTTNGSQLTLGSLNVGTGNIVPLLDNSTGNVFAFNTAQSSAVKVDYYITRSTSLRTGTMWITSTGTSGNVNIMEDYTENDEGSLYGNSGVTLSATQSGSTVTVAYQTTNRGSGNDGTMSFNVSYFQTSF